MALVDVGIRGLEFEVPDEWSESQVNSATRTRYPFLFPDLVSRAGTSPETLRAADVRGILPPAVLEAARPPTIDEFQPGPITIAPNALRPPPETPLPVDAGPALSPTGRPLDAAQLAFQDRFPQSRPPRPDEPGGQPNIVEALAKEYLRTVSGAAPTAIESIRMFQNAFGPGMLTDVLRNPVENLVDPAVAAAKVMFQGSDPRFPILPQQAAATLEKAADQAALRTEASRLDPIYTAAREFRQATQDAYDYNREALPAWQQKPAEWIGGGAGSATTFIPAALLGPAGVFGMSAAQTFSPSYEESRAAGATPKQALQQAVIASAAEALSEYVLGVPGQLSRLMGKKAPAKESIEKAIKEAVESRWKTAAKTVPREAIEEPISGAVQDISAAEITGADPSKGLTGKDKQGTPNWQSFLKRRVDDLMGGAVGGAVFIPAVRSAQQQSAMQLAEAKGARQDPAPFRTAMRKAALKDEVWRTRAEADAAKGLPPRESTLADDLFAIGQRMEKAGFDDLEIQNSIDDTLNRISAARAAEQEPPTAPPVTGTDWTDAAFRKALRAASIPKDVTVEFNTTEAKLVPGPDGDYRLPGQWDGKRIVVWTPNIRSFAHLVAVLKEENNHRIIGTEPGQAALRGFLVQHPLTGVLASSPAWLREELAKYEGQGDAVITEEFIAKLGAEPSWKQWVAQARIFFKKLFGRELTAEEAARVLLRQLQQGKFSVAPVTPTPVTPPAAEVPSAPSAPISPPTTPTGASPVPAAAPAPTEPAAAPVTPAAAPSFDSGLREASASDARPARLLSPREFYERILSSEAAGGLSPETREAVVAGGVPFAAIANVTAQTLPKRRLRRKSEAEWRRFLEAALRSKSTTESDKIVFRRWLRDASPDARGRVVKSLEDAIAERQTRMAGEAGTAQRVGNLATTMQVLANNAVSLNLPVNKELSDAVWGEAPPGWVPSVEMGVEVYAPPGPPSPAPPAEPAGTRPDKETPPTAPTSQPGAAVGVVAPPVPSEPTPTSRKVAEEVVKPPTEPPEWVADELGKLDALLEKAAKGPAVSPGTEPAAPAPAITPDAAAIRESRKALREGPTMGRGPGLAAPASVPTPEPIAPASTPPLPADLVTRAVPDVAKLRDLLAKPLGPKDRIAVSKTGADLARTLTSDPGLRKFAPFARTVLADLGDAARPFLLSWYTNARISNPDQATYDSEAEAQATYDREFADRTRYSIGEIYATLDDAIGDSGRRAVSGSLRAGRGGGGRPGAKVVRAELIPTPRRHVTEDTYAPGFRLTPHQALGINQITDLFLNNPDGAVFVLADGTGFGKTAQLVSAVDQYFRNYPNTRVLLVSQNQQILKTRFASEMKRMGIKVPPTGELVLATYSTLHKLDRKKGFDLALYDEAHNLKNDTSRKSVAAALLPAKHKVFATATPMDKPTHAAYFLAEALGEDEVTVARDLGYELTTRTDPYTGEDVTFAVLRPGFSWEKVWANIIAYRDALIGSGSMLRREYPYFGDIIHDAKPLPADAKASEGRIALYYDRLIEGASNPNARRNYAGQKTLTLSRWTELQKIGRALDATRKWLAAHPKGQVVIIGETAQEQSFPIPLPGAVKRFNKDKARDYYYLPGALETIGEALEKEGVAVSRIYGDAEKSDEVGAFQAQDTRVALATPQSGGAGIDLDDTAGDAPRLLLMLSKNFAADILDQILGRVSRMNTKSESLATFLTTDSYSDSRREMVLDRKLKTLRAIQGGEDADVAAGIEVPEAPRYSIGDRVTPEQDAAYLAAAERGDMETAQRMVDEAAKRAGYNTKVAGFYVKNSPDNIAKLPWWAQEIYDFGAKASREDPGGGFTTAKQYHTAARYGDAIEPEKESVTYSALRYWDGKDGTLANYIFERGLRGGKIGDFVFAERVGKSPDAGYSYNYRDQYGELGVSVIGLLDPQKGLIRENDGTFELFNDGERRFVGGFLTPYRGSDGERLLIGVQFDGDRTQIKSADPVTRDASGNVIPLSQRFNPESSDIRYSIGDRVTTTISGTEQTLAPEQALKRARGLEYTLSRLADCLGK